MQIHQLKPIHKQKKHKRVGRGGKKGTYSGRGMKGQRSRAGRKMQPSIRELIKKFHKLKGYRVERLQKTTVIVDIFKIEQKFEPSETVSPQSLLEKGLIRRIAGKMPVVKILGGKEIKKSLVFENCLFSKKAREIAEKSGSTIK